MSNPLRPTTWVIASAAAAGILVLMILFAARSDKPSRSAGLSESDLVVHAQVQIRKRLRDPESVRFERWAGVRDGTAVAACGEVNAKNGFGGYTGAVAWFYSEDTARDGTAILCEVTTALSPACGTALGLPAVSSCIAIAAQR